MKMKRSTIIYAMAALALTACSSDENLDNLNSPVEIRLSSGLEVQEVGTRAATDIFNNRFDNGETVDVFINEKTDGTATTTYPQPLQYTTVANGALNLVDETNRPYFPTSGNGVEIYAVYPSNIGSIFTVETDQSSDENYKKSDLMQTRTSVDRPQKDPIALRFEHKLSKVIVTLISGAGSPDLDGATIKLKNAKTQVAFTAATGTVTDKQDSQTSDITVGTATSGNLSRAAILPPQTLQQDFVEITLKNGGVLTGSLNNGQPVLEKGNAYKYPSLSILPDLALRQRLNLGMTGMNTRVLPGCNRKVEKL